MRHSRLVAGLTVGTLLTGSATGCTGSPEPSPKPRHSSSPAPAGVDYTTWSAGRSTPVADPIYPKRGNPLIDVLHYGLDLEWAPARKSLTGTATLRVRPTADAPSLSLDFMPYALDGVSVDGATVAATVSGEKLTVPAKVAKDRPVTLVVRYHGTPKATPMPSHRRDSEPLGLTVTAEGGLRTMQEPYGAFTWYPANDQPSDEALYDIAVTVPAGWSAIASGTPVDQGEAGGQPGPASPGGTPAGPASPGSTPAGPSSADGTPAGQPGGSAATGTPAGNAAAGAGTTFRYRSTDPVASYLATLAVGRYRKETAKGPHGLPLTYWYRPSTDKRLLPVLRRSPSMLAWLEKKLGPYPFPTAGVVIVDSESAMETQQMITMGGRVGNWSKRKSSFEADLLHEYAHQWLGDSVTLTNWKDMWLNEGWTMYIQYLWMVERDGLSHHVLDNFLPKLDAQVRKELGPPGKPKPGNFAEFNVYGCPAAMLHQLRRMVGDKKFFALTRAWAQEKGKQYDRASFIAFANRQTGRNLTKVINSWLDSKKPIKG